MAVLDAAEAILIDEAKQADSLEVMRGQEPHHLAELRAQLEADDVDESEVIDLTEEPEEARVIDMATWVAEANRSVK